MRAASDTSSWVFTGGTDSGVMEIIASAMRNNDLDLPVIGFTPHGNVEGRHLLDEAAKARDGPFGSSLIDQARGATEKGGLEVAYDNVKMKAELEELRKKEQDAVRDFVSGSAVLNAEHSHFVLVDVGLEGRDAWGTELAFRCASEAHCAKVSGKSAVQLVVRATVIEP